MQVWRTIMSFSDNVEDELSQANMSAKHRAPVGWQPNIEFDPNTSMPKNITTLAGELIEDEDWTKALALMNVSLPTGYEIRPTSMSYDPVAWTRDSVDQKAAVTRGAWRYKFAVVESVGVGPDLPALYLDIHKAPIQPYKATESNFTTVVAWADIQVGKVDHLGGTEELLIRLDEKRLALEEHLKQNRPQHIVVADVGDIVEGFSNVKSQTRTNDLSLMDQVDLAATELWKTIRLCAKFAPVDVISIPSNHAQWRAGKDLIGKPSDDWGLHINQRLERLNDEVGLDVTFTRSDPWDETLTFDIQGTTLGLAHGHQAASPTAVTTWWGKMTHSGNLADVTVLLTGHYHFASIRPSGRDPRTGKSKWHLQAPTLDNGSAWVKNKMGEDGDPGLMVFSIDDNGFNMQSLTIL
jgi:hypothetical protein